MKVLKFGGTSVGSVNSMLSVKKIIEADYTELQAEVGAKKANLIKHLS